MTPLFGFFYTVILSILTYASFFFTCTNKYPQGSEAVRLVLFPGLTCLFPIDLFQRPVFPDNLFSIVLSSQSDMHSFLVYRVFNEGWERVERGLGGVYLIEPSLNPLWTLSQPPLNQKQVQSNFRTGGKENLTSLHPLQTLFIHRTNKKRKQSGITMKVTENRITLRAIFIGVVLKINCTCFEINPKKL